MTREQRIQAFVAEVAAAEQHYGLKLTVRTWIDSEMLGDVLQARPRVKWEYGDIPNWTAPEAADGDLGE